MEGPDKIFMYCCIKIILEEFMIKIFDLIIIQIKMQNYKDINELQFNLIMELFF